MFMFLSPSCKHVCLYGCWWWLLQGEYYEAVAKAVDVQRKELVACFPKDAGLDEACFKISYDILIVGVSRSSEQSVLQQSLHVQQSPCPATFSRCLLAGRRCAGRQREQHLWHQGREGALHVLQVH